MGKEYAVLSFFKQKKIDYLFLPEKNQVVIPCPHCGKPINMCTDTTEWDCHRCETNGNLINFIKGVQKGEIKSKIYNPKRERKELLQMIHKLRTETNREQIDKMKEKLDRLINYYKKEG
ncbi:hypothetical protein BKP35_08505 [Anaerobacillus arseniciselenatis]|uniref:Uncharacterized protein n=1 Tax=Anaerobacillus arseniciselenatis TaxID=85682 RepID=A0A1S2LNN3_9BACI|nr:hypothetical protein [Anaerobacillus arseniciselenatis]OIJ13810.1 hypothetical protein BKP35_08505 [Anaerobacillus arseniciselenatis]